MELRVLRYYLAVASENSISAAAEQLHITQPTLSRQIRELEEELGTTLFVRSKKSRRLALTEDGFLLRERAKEIVALADKTAAELNSSHEEISGEVYVGGGESSAMHFFADAFQQLHQDFPNVRLHLFSGNADDVSDRLDQGLLDFGFFIGTVNLDKYDYLSVPESICWGLLMHRSNPLAEQDSISISDLMTIPLIVSRQSLFYNELGGWSGIDFEDLDIVASYNLIYNGAHLVANGIGSAVCIDGIINTTGTDLVFRPLDPPLHSSCIVAWKKNTPHSKAAALFLDHLRQVLNK